MIIAYNILFLKSLWKKLSDVLRLFQNLPDGRPAQMDWSDFALLAAPAFYILRFWNLPFPELSRKTLAFAQLSDYNYTVIFRQTMSRKSYLRLQLENKTRLTPHGCEWAHKPFFCHDSIQIAHSTYDDSIGQKFSPFDTQQFFVQYKNLHIRRIAQCQHLKLFCRLSTASQSS